MKLIKLLPNIRDEDCDATTGYIWGKPKDQSNIMRTIPAYTHGLIKDIVAERWCCSDDGKWPSMITETLSLRDLLSAEGERILGKRHCHQFGSYLGTVMKLLDTSADPAKGTLSIQVHPHDGHPTRPPKPEMWEASEGSVYFGLKEEHAEEELLQAAREGNIDKMLWKVSFNKGDLLEAPGGMIHALRYGGFFMEWSMAYKKNGHQGSLADATVALSDRGDGKLVARPGKEHPEEALEVVKAAGMLKAIDPMDYVQQASVISTTAEYTHLRLFDTKYAVVDKYEITGPCTISLQERGLSSYLKEGVLEVTSKDSVGAEMYLEGEEAMLPHYMDELTFTPTSSSATLYIWYAPST